ncbi:MAG: hypothetical protein A2W93_03280 [Bacteroidetes bacterium GWF2_43_63]|nr:MAG: hypothetical protein A2W94_09280 [Bacteroidetes bacterium GWE2_42_42]OFY53682.1 MAG: hypothetical protein A2W93_03280 [Bacteroidetes bacterium GWF2_43_63]HBG70972.1 hypothetical protein [Bacteroidales bacterium]HCB62937.1 hypothetical protein [Bacteroidales bacterium]HCY24299.1 hypothetical protein [Bacteroidales bacterium]
MKAKITILILGMLLSFLSAQSQTIVFSENFETLPLSVTSSGAGNWARSTYLHADGAYSDTAIVTMASSTYLTTPAFSTLGNFMVTLEFDQICKIEFFDGGFVEYSTNNGATWTVVSSAYYQGSGVMVSNKFTANSYVSTWMPASPSAVPTNTWWKHEKFDISALVGNQASVMIRFKLSDLNNNGPNLNYGWALDNISVNMAIDEMDAPVITMIPPYPVDTVYHTGPFTVNAIIADASGVDTALLIYTVNDGFPDTLTMLAAGSNQFQAVIPAANLSDSINYYIYATDSALTSNSAVYPAIDDIQFIVKESPPPAGCTTPLTAFPYLETMESFTVGVPGVFDNGWAASPSSGYMWVVDAGGTPTTSTTGPAVDHTLGTASGIYLFTEATSGTAGDSAFLFSPCIDITDLTHPVMSFWYHRYGSAMGELHVDIWYGNQWYTDIVPAFIGQQQTDNTDPYSYVLVDLAPYKSVTQIRFRAIRGSGGNGDMALDDIQIYDLAPIDAAAVELSEPTSPASTGLQDVKVRIANMGASVLNNVTINWSIDGVTQTPLLYSIPTLSLDTSAAITLGSYDFSVGVTNIRVFTSNPNGVADTLNGNDTLDAPVFVCGTGLAGTFTVGAPGNDFLSISQASEVLQLCGISAPVVFEIAPGEYEEQIEIYSVNGSSAVNTITFTSSTGNAADVVMKYTADATGNNYVTRIIGADNMIFSDFTMQSTGGTYSRVLDITGSTNRLTFDGMTFESPVTAAGSSTNNAVVYNASSLDSNMTFRNCDVLNGSYGMYLYNSSTTIDTNLLVENCTVSGFSYYGINAYYHTHGIIRNNTIISADGTVAYSSVYSLRPYYFDFGTLTGNKVIASGSAANYALYAYYMDAAAGSEGIVANNFFVAGRAGNTGTTYGMYMGTNTFLNVYANSVNVINNATTSRAFYLTGGTNYNIIDNIFANQGGGHAYYIGTIAAVLTSNYNDLYTTGATLAYWTAARADLAALQASSGKDLNSVSVDPSFNSPTDLHTYAAGLSNAGTPIAVITTDIDGQARNATTPDIGADEFDLMTNDMAIVQMTAPASTCGGAAENVTIQIKNIGSATLTSSEIAWKVNGVSQTPFSFSGPLAQGSFAQVTLGTYTFLPAVTYDLEFMVNTINGVPDQNTSNDTLSVVGFRTSLGGTYTIGATGDYGTISAAANDLMSRGICSSVVFNIQSGIYNESISLTEISGCSATNTITFQSASGNAADVSVTYASVNANDNFVFWFNGADYVSLKNLSLTNTGSTYAGVVVISGGANYNTVDHCVLTGITDITSSTNTYVVNNKTGLDHYNTLSNNIINNGSRGIYWYGSSSTFLENGSVITGNTLNDFGYYGMYVYYTGSSVISDNTLNQTSGTTYSTLYGYYIGYSDTLTFTKNTAKLRGTSTVYGLYSYYNDGFAGSQNLIANNMITATSVSATGTVYGIRAYYNNYTQYYHNSVLVNSSGGRAFDQYYGGNIILANNSFVNEATGYAIYSTPVAGIIASDYNNLFTNGINVGYFNSAARATLADWQAASGFDANSVSMDPNYLSTFDLHTFDAPFNNLGTPIALVTDDIDGQMRDGATPDIGADEYSPLYNEIEMLAFTSPYFECAGTSNVLVHFYNNGLNPITASVFNWTLDGVPQTPFTFGGTLISNEDTIVNIGTVTVNATTQNIVAWVTSVNGTSDDHPENDTIQTSFSAALAGTFTIGVTGDYTTLQAAATDLNTKGVCGPVVFNVLPGTYNEQISLENVFGATAVNTITFQSSTGDSSDVVIHYASSTSADNYVVKLTNVSYTTFQNLTMSATGATYATVINFAGTNHVDIKNCELIGAQINSSSVNYAVIYSAASDDSYNEISNNLITGGSYGIRLYGPSSTAPETGNILQNNNFDGYSYYGVYSYYQRDLTFSGNKVEFDSTYAYTTNYGLYMGYITGSSSITGNNVASGGTATSYGIYLTSITGNTGNPVLITNNFITIARGTGTMYGIYGSSGTNINIAHNSIHHMVTGGTTSRLFYTAAAFKADTVMNNIFYASGNAQVYYLLANPTVFDYNAIYTTGTYGYANTTTYATMAAWQAAGFEPNSISTNPQYAGWMDLHIANPMLNGTAAPMASVNVDIDNEVRSISSDIGADEFTPTGLDAAIVWLGPLKPVTPGSYPVEVIVTNTKTTPITELSITYTDGITPVTESFTGLNLLSNESDTITFTTQFAFSTYTTLFAYINSVNSVTDDLQLNDATETSTLCSVLAGTYSINPALPVSTSNFTSFTSVIEALYCGGISSNVTFEVASGFYNEQISLGPVEGTGPGSRITFTSATGNPADVVITFAPVVSTANYVLNVNGIEYLTFEDMTLTNSGTALGHVIEFTGNSDSVIIRNNVLNGVINSSTSTSYSVVYSGGNLNHNTIFDGNTINNGTSGIYVRGVGTADREMGVKVINNSINNFSYYGIYSYYSTDLYIDGNLITSAPESGTYTSLYGIYAYYSDSLRTLSDNMITLTPVSSAYGVYMPYVVNSATSRAPVYNNMISVASSVSSSSTFHGMYFSTASYLDLNYNTIYVRNASTSSNALYMSSGSNFRLLNNNLVNNGEGRAIYAGTSVLSSSDYNNLYTNGATLGYFTAARTNLAAWQAASAMDAHSVSLMPNFYSEQNLHIVDFSLMGLATPVASITTDIDGDARDASTPDIGADEYSPLLTDAGISAFDQPTIITSAGLNDISVTITNYGSAVLDTAQIEWTWNNLPQTTNPWSGSLAFAQSEDSVLLANLMLSPGISTFKAWTSMPNNTTDLNYFNDTTEFTVVACEGPLAGNYTIGSTGDYASFNEAILIIESCGIDSLVIFDVLPGTYEENVVVGFIPGASAVNTVTFRSQTGLATDVVLLPTILNSDLSIVQFNNTDYVTWQNMTINGTAHPFVRGITLINENNNLTLSGNVIHMPDVSTSTTNIVGIYDAAGNDDSLTVVNNTIHNGSYGMYIYGTSTALQNGTLISGNTVTGFANYGMRIYYMNAPVISQNYIYTDTLTYSAIYGLYTGYLDNAMLIEKNKIILPANMDGYGLYLYYNDGTTSNPGSVVNNFVSIRGNNSSISYGVYMSSCNYQNFVFNSINVYDNFGTSRAFYVSGGANNSLFNNIIANTGSGFAMYFSSTTAVTASDNNLLYTGGSVLGYYSANRTDLAAWKTASSLDAHSVSFNPLFFSNSDLHVFLASLNAAALPIAGITTDIDGDARHASSPDIGADEFVPLNVNLGITHLLKPTNDFGLTSESDTVKVRIFNFGANTASSFNITYKLNGVIIQTQPWTGSLTSGTSTDVEFTTLFAPQTGWNTLEAFVSIAADGNLSNDTVSTMYKGIPTLNIPYAEDFEANDYWGANITYNGWEFGIPAGTVIDSAYSPDMAWKTNIDGIHGNSQNIVLYSPVFSFLHAYNAQLSFWHWYDTDAADGGYIQYTANGGTTWNNLGVLNDPSGTNWAPSPVYTGFGWSGHSGGWVQSSIDLSFLNFNPFETQFRFIFYSNMVGTNGDGWAIDNVEIIIPQADIDAGVVEIVTPSGTLTPGVQEAITVKITNYGINTLTSIPVVAKANTGQPPINGTWTGSLASGDTTTFTFPANYTPVSVPDFELCAYTDISNDYIAYNDTSCVTLFTNVGFADNNLTEISLSPNPADDFTRLEFEAGTSEHAVLTITTADGKHVRETTVSISAGINNIRIETADLASGLYHWTLRSNNSNGNGKLIINR